MGKEGALNDDVSLPSSMIILQPGGHSAFDNSIPVYARGNRAVPPCTLQKMSLERPQCRPPNHSPGKIELAKTETLGQDLNR